MNEPVEMTIERAAEQSAHALLLSRIFATVLTIVLLVTGLIMSSFAGRLEALFAELGTAALPVVSATAVRHGGGIMVGLLVLSAITMFFIWARGKAAAWMAGLGLLLMAFFVPVMVFALFVPLVRIMAEMGNM